MESKEKNTKEKILEEALKLFAQSGYMGTSMNDIASKLGVTKAALYKHYKSKQEILDSIIEKMKELDIERAKQYEMPEGDLEKVTAEYKEMAFDKIKQFTKVQFLHWTEEEFSSCFRKMLTLEQYREPQMAQLYQNYLASGPLTYMEALFSGMPEGDLEKVTAEYKEMAFDKIKQFTKVQFLHWTEEEFSSCFRKMLTLEQYREPQMAQLYQNYLASGPLTYMEALFSGMLGDAGKARQTALDFYGPIFLLYSIYDGAEDKSHVIKLLEEHMDHFLQEMQIS